MSQFATEFIKRKEGKAGASSSASTVATPVSAPVGATAPKKKKNKAPK